MPFTKWPDCDLVGRSADVLSGSRSGALSSAVATSREGNRSTRSGPQASASDGSSKISA